MHQPPLILLVDDDPQIQDLYSLKLKAAGFGYIRAWNGEEGLKLIKQEKPDLVLLDVMMPVMDGPKMLMELRSDPEFKTTPVLILTSLQDRPEDIKFAKEIGAVDFINKDIEFATLVEKIKALLHQ